jgi:hypothetical protein
MRVCVYIYTLMHFSFTQLDQLFDMTLRLAHHIESIHLNPALRARAKSFVT